MSRIELATKLGYKTTAATYLLENFEVVPGHERAGIMAEVFEWDSAGEVIDFWASHAAPAERDAR